MTRTRAAVLAYTHKCRTASRDRLVLHHDSLASRSWQAMFVVAKMPCSCYITRGAGQNVAPGYIAGVPKSGAGVIGWAFAYVLILGVSSALRSITRAVRAPLTKALRRSEGDAASKPIREWIYMSLNRASGTANSVDH